MNFNVPGLSETLFDKDPFIQFSRWFADHSLNFSGEKNAVALSTSWKDGRVSSRIVLLKEYDGTGMVFYTNYDSKKGRQLAENSFASLLFYWPEIHRQVRIEGLVQKVPEEISDKYFHSRPRESQLSAAASPQSSPIPGRKYLIDKANELRLRYEGSDVKRPENWGGYKLVPDWFEFWQEGEHRLHDRITYELSGNGWIINRLAP